MQRKFMWLQLFADGAAAAGDGGAAATGDNAVAANPGATPEAAAQETRADRLAKLGVPKDKLNRRAYTETVNPQPKTAETVQEQAAAADNQEAEPENVESKLPFEEIIKDPEYKDEYNRRVQDIVTKRVAKMNQMKEDLAPALELLAQKHGLDTSDMENLDLKALSQAIVNDPSFYEDKAIELGVSVEVAKQIEQAERIQAQNQQREQLSIQQQKIQEHLNNLQNEAATLKKTFPDFDLSKELENGTFVRLTAPDSGLTLEEAYFAVHRKDILNAVTKNTQQQIANAIQAGQRRPNEGGVPKSNNASVTSFNWHNASKQQREDMKKQIYEAAARGERIKPGGFR